METLQIALADGGKKVLESQKLEQLRTSFRGKLIRPGEPGYDDARSIWNAMIDRKPALIAVCEGTEDVRAAINFARANKLRASVKSVGHNIAGNALCDDGLVIDLSKMRSISVDPKARRMSVEPGATLGDVDKASQAHKMVVPFGINSTTGVAGLTLGGGFGWLSRKFGMSVDNLSAAEVVTADGKVRRAASDENPELFWAIRGGGGNFGVVTKFEFRLNPLDHDVLSGLVVYPVEQAVTALKKYREFAAGLGDDTSVWVVLRKAPPLPFIPAEYHGKGIIAFAVFHAGDPDKGRKILQPIWEFGEPIGEHVGVQPYVNWQSAFDPLLTEGARNYWKSHNFAKLSDDTIKVIHRYATSLPSPHCEIFIAQLGGAINRVAKDATAYPHRDIQFVMNVHSRWETAKEDTTCITWARDFFRDTLPYATGGVYVNFMTGEETDRVHNAYGPAYDRLVKAKREYDPENIFCMNQNINPKM